MLTQIVLLVILISGSVFGSAVCKKRFEDLLPITCTSIVVLLFLYGILRILKQGFFVVLVFSIFLWIYSLAFLIKNKSWISFAEFFFTPAFFVFVAAYLVLTYTNYGMMAASWDEFSHWADIVKAMVSIDDFGTNPAAHSMFQSYPPGMSLFQYFFERVFLLFNKNKVFSEWRLYFSYQILFLSFLMPFLRDLNFKKISVNYIFKMFLTAVLCCLGPMLIFNNIYNVILIDAFLGLIAGTGVAMIFVRKDKDWCYDAYIILNITMLVLTKDAGTLFAIFMAAIYILDNVFVRKEGKVKKVILSILGIVAVSLPKILWSFNIKSNHAYVAFSEKVDLRELFRVFFGLDRTSYRAEVVKKFIGGLFNQCFQISVMKIEVPYIVFLSVLLIACYIMCKKYQNWKKFDYGMQKIVYAALVIESIVYILGLCITYMFKFSEYEAVRIASFGRYMNILLQQIMIFILILVINDLINHERQKYFEIFVLCGVLTILPWGEIKDVATRTTVSNTVNTRARYMPIVEQVEDLAASTGEIYRINVISQESAGYDRMILRYSLRPHEVVGSESIGEPFYEGDIWTININADQWQKELQKDVDYVALYRLNDYFMEVFSEVFENPEDIHENGLYRVDKESGLLILCTQ